MPLRSGVVVSNQQAEWYDSHSPGSMALVEQKDRRGQSHGNYLYVRDNSLDGMQVYSPRQQSQFLPNTREYQYVHYSSQGDRYKPMVGMNSLYMNEDKDRMPTPKSMRQHFRDQASRAGGENFLQSIINDVLAELGARVYAPATRKLIENEIFNEVMAWWFDDRRYVKKKRR